MLQTNLLFYASIILFGVAAFILSLNLFSDEEKFKTSELLDSADDKEDEAKKKKEGIILRTSRPFFKRYIGPVVSSMKNKKAIREKYKRSLANAGLSDILTPDDLYSFKLFLILGFPIVYLVLKEFAEMTDWPVGMAPFTGILGFFYPDFWIKGKIEERQKEIIFNMPFVVDMLALSVEAGLDFMAAIMKVIEKAPKSVLTEEFETMIREIRIGQSRAEGLRALVWRTNVIELASFSATLIAADSVGASIGPILKSLAAEMRQKRSAMIEKKGAQAATKILFPMLFLIAPSVFLVIGSPVVVQLASSGGF